MKNKLPVIVITLIAVAGGSFFGGMKYAESKSARGRLSQADFQGLQDLSPEERQQRLQQFGTSVGGFRGGANGGRGGQGGGFTAGEIILKDDKSVTVKLRDGSGSKIIFVSLISCNSVRTLLLIMEFLSS